MAREITPGEQTFLSACEAQFSSFGKLKIGDELNRAYEAIVSEAPVDSKDTAIKQAVADYRLNHDVDLLLQAITVAVPAAAEAVPASVPAEAFELSAAKATKRVAVVAAKAPTK